MLYTAARVSEQLVIDALVASQTLRKPSAEMRGLLLFVR
jgi:hypothetical protein